jgi:hypothetical protein
MPPQPVRARAPSRREAENIADETLRVGPQTQRKGFMGCSERMAFDV